MSYQSLNSAPEAKDVAFDNTNGNGFTSTNAQAAIEEARYAEIALSVTGTTAQSTTNTAFTLLNGMQLTVPQTGTYEVQFNADCNTTGVNGSGEWAIFQAGTIVSGTTRGIATNVSILGLITLSVNTIRAPISINWSLTATQGQLIQIGWRSANAIGVSTGGRFLKITRIA